jgi:hypothetical protein
MRVSPRVPFILTACIAMASAAQATECLSSASAVWAAHPGSHATWSLRLPGHEGTKCWFASSREGEETRVGVSKDAAHESSAKFVPAPRPRSQDTPADDERAPLLFAEPASEGATRSILMWGVPMLIDATWEKLFEKRERRAE